MTKKSSRIVAVIMLIIAIIFFVVASGKFPLEQYHYIYSLWDICYYNDNTVYCSI